MKKLLSAQQLRFGLVGVGNTLVDLVGYTVLFALGTPLVIANLISTTMGMALSFTLNRSFTFRASGGGMVRQVLLFVLVTGIGLWAIQPLVIVLTRDLFAGLPETLAIAAPKFVGICVALVWNYVLYSRLVFRPVEEPVKEPVHD
ncbi:GtrA family protein [Lentzea nigeriaca]|uniref:GtrA family protein n=1 Tax=Lentzea nigeriaca TaxID=1128665 RepID=UPI0027DACAA6|nr:GtrA family protein [Lentzea nigeriaca]MBM7859700.1 putative flippase GtrA [Lentzea nigeriaca]